MAAICRAVRPLFPGWLTSLLPSSNACTQSRSPWQHRLVHDYHLTQDKASRKYEEFILSNHVLFSQTEFMINASTYVKSTWNNAIFISFIFLNFRQYYHTEVQINVLVPSLCWCCTLGKMRNLVMLCVDVAIEFHSLLHKMPPESNQSFVTVFD